MCRFLGVSRQAWYQGEKRVLERQAQAEAVTAFVSEVRRRQPCIGSRKLHHMMQESEDMPVKIGRDKLFEVLRAHHLLVAKPRAFHKTTQSYHHFRKHPNLLKPGPDQVKATAPEQVWVADITYLPTQEGTSYVSLVTDAYSRKIVGYHVHDTLHAEEVAKALQMALAHRQHSHPLVHHSDRGVQYCARNYQQLHEEHGLRCSMTDGYDCYQNALAERINGILKTEFLLHRPRATADALQMVRESVDIYNQERPHLALQYKTPDAVHRAF